MIIKNIIKKMKKIMANIKKEIIKIEEEPMKGDFIIIVIEIMIQEIKAMIVIVQKTTKNITEAITKEILNIMIITEIIIMIEIDIIMTMEMIDIIIIMAIKKEMDEKIIIN